MNTLTIRNLDDALKTRLQVVAASHGHSIEEEARLILMRVLPDPTEQKGLGSEIRQLFQGQDLPELELPARNR
jgi:antitoxin FitA